LTIERRRKEPLSRNSSFQIHNIAPKKKQYAQHATHTSKAIFYAEGEGARRKNLIAARQ
jgi:hypothetical protein